MYFSQTLPFCHLGLNPLACFAAKSWDVDVVGLIELATGTALWDEELDIGLVS